jgi:hypothetical protein
MSSLLDSIESAVAEVPEEVGAALKFIGSEITKLGALLEALAARMDERDKPAA